MMRQTSWKTRYIPIFLHGDGTPITGIGKSWAKSSQIWNWGSLLARGPTREIVFWIWSVFKESMTRSTTRSRFWKILCWSLRSLQAGLWPATNWNGLPWEPGSIDAMRAGTPLVGDDLSTRFACQIWRAKGDLEDFHEDRSWCTMPAHLQSLHTHELVCQAVGTECTVSKVSWVDACMNST